MKKAIKTLTALMLLPALLCGCAPAAPGGTNENLQITNSEADPVMQNYVDEAWKLLKEHGGEAESVWPGYTLPKNAIIVCQRDDETDKVIHAWMLTTTEKVELTNEQLAGVEIPAAGTYGKLTFDGRKSIIIAINNAIIPGFEDVAIANFIYEVGVHEMVHLHYESMLKLIKLGREQAKHGGRGTAFPKAAEPRVYRKMLYDNLAAAFEHPQEEDLYLGRAKYWFEKWRAEYPGEYYQIKVTDVLEGKARYIQYMLCMPGGLSEEEKAAWIAGCFDRTPEPSDSMDSESYKLGFVSGVLLDRREAGWKKQVTKQNIPITEYLLRSVAPVTDESGQYDALLEISRAQMAQINADLEEKLEPVRQADENLQIPLLEINQKNMVGSFETSGFVNYLGKSITTDFVGTFESRNGTVKIDGLNVYQTDKMYVLPLTMDYTLEDGRLVIESGGVICDSLVKQSADGDGRTVFTMQ